MKPKKTRSEQIVVAVHQNRVKELREDKTWTKAELARRSSVAVATIDAMEHGRSTRKDRRLKVAKALEKPYSEVFPNEND